MLYKTVIERMLAYGAAVWCLHPQVRIRRKLNTNQRPFLLALTEAYRTTATSALHTCHTCNSSSLPPLPAEIHSNSHSKNEHLTSGRFDNSRFWRG
ncbi:hypothetical protein AVEN_271268-1 [Araneus ventricosus]|uniref:Uncharacterized protein n=1 Tax=Araneus ventricosus TaxID=182803 RepID=A0A4Y2G3I5_ARAVE|nr:hypothetical protein AVEN_271268-1 [Araneus ventricosus]